MPCAGKKSRAFALKTAGFSTLRAFCNATFSDRKTPGEGALEVAQPQAPMAMKNQNSVSRRAGSA
jgi:hypothetical protein